MTIEERLEKLERELLPAKPRPVSLVAAGREAGGPVKLYVLWSDGKVTEARPSMNLNR